MANNSFKKWEEGDIVRDQEVLPLNGTTSYDNVEGLIGDDINNQIDLGRVSRNLFENSNNVFDFLAKLADATGDNERVYKGSLEQAFTVANKDITYATFAGTKEQFYFDVSWSSINDIQSKYFDLHSPSTNYYAWFNLDSLGIDPGVAHPEITDITVSTFSVSAIDLQSQYFTINSTTINYYVWFNVDGGGTDPALGGTGIQVTLSSGTDTENTTAAAIASALTGYSSGSVFSANATTNVVTVTNVVAGSVTDATAGTAGVTINVTTQGLNAVASLSGLTSITISINTSTMNTVDAVATQAGYVIDQLSDFGTTAVNQRVTITNVVSGNVVDAGTINTTGFSFTKVTDGSDGYHYYSRLRPGIAYVNGQVVVNRPQTFIAERILTKILGLQNWLALPEKITINYDYTNDKYQARITKYDTSNVLQTYDFINGGIWGDMTTGYDTGIQMLAAIYNHSVFNSAMVSGVGANIHYITLEPTYLFDTANTFTRYWSIDNTGSIVLGSAPIGSGNGIDLYTIDFTTDMANPPTVNSITDTRKFFQTFQDFDNNIYLNVPKSWNTDSTINITNALDPADTSVTWSDVVNTTSFITVLRQNNTTYDSTSAALGFVEGKVGLEDVWSQIPTGSGDPQNMFYMNKNLLVQWGPNAGDWATFADVVASASSGLPSASSYASISSAVPTPVDGSLCFVRDVNQMYRYSSDISSWIPVSDPYKQMWNIVGTKLGNASDNTPTNTIFTFSGLDWKTDGSNLNVYVNGVFQVQNSPSLTDQDYSVSARNQVTFNTTLADTDKVIVRIIEGGEDYFPDKANYTAGTAVSPYTGGLTDFEVNFQTVIGKEDVYINGVLQRDSEFFDNFTETSGGSVGIITDSSKSYTVNALTGYFVEIINATLSSNNGEVRRVASNTATAITLDSNLPANITIGDTIVIYKDFDYFVDEKYNKIIMSNALVSGQFVDIRDRAAVASSYSLMHKGTTFPSNPIFGFMFFKSDTAAWYLYNGTAWTQI